jgi:hypothetical protein
MARLAILVLAAATAGFAGQGLWSEGPGVGHSVVGAKVMGCNIKGNVSYNGGAKIYHMPGQRDYASTIISTSRGERWFCSEGEARAAGWRKAGR